MTAPAKHTPGPWRAYRSADGTRWCVTARESGTPYTMGSDVAMMDAGWRGDLELEESNARLIASAPDLAARVAELEELTRAVSEFFRDTDAPLGKRARAALTRTRDGAK